jgi:hypothetical protein
MVGEVTLKQVTIKHAAVEHAAVEHAIIEFDYDAAAELFPSRKQKSTRRPIGYRRFGHAADAIRFAIEELPPEFLLGACLEVDEERYNNQAIRRLYDSMDYPLIRSAQA